jgi:hypothetical protein
MKTTLQELIEWCNQYEGQMISADQVVLHAHKLIKKEKEQLQQYFEYGIEAAEDYYNQTYKQNK